MSQPVFHGDLLLQWCHSCNVAVLGKKCACGDECVKVNVTPPGDIRPAFLHDIEHINRISKQQFNNPLLDTDRVVLLNKAPYEDRMDEIIVDGEVIASIRYEIGKLEWVLLPRLEAGRRILAGKETLTGYVTIEEDVKKFLHKGANLLAPGVLDADSGIQKDDEVIIITPSREVIATGRARMDGREMMEAKKGTAVKPRWKADTTSKVNDRKPSCWDDVIRANRFIMDESIAEAHTFIQKTIEKEDLPISVSYSGGKDSLAVMQLVDECVGDYEIMFADTGLEFPETLDNIDHVGELYSKDVKSISVGDAFWDSIDAFGPPAVEMRWCCKVCKLGPISRLIEENYEKGCLTFVGQRKYESTTRARSNRVWKNPWVGNQTAASPIQDWTALHIWLYIFMNDLPYNPLYEKGFDRMGCWLCPSSSLGDLKRLKETHPHYEEKLMKHLYAYAGKNGIDKEWADYGFWRWKTLPPNIKKIAEELGINTAPTRYNPNKLTFTSSMGHRPCTTGEMTAEGSFSTALDMEKIRKSGMLLAIGEVKYTDEMAMVTRKKDTAQVFATGSVRVRASSKADAGKLLRDTENSIRRALGCTGCGVCIGKCPRSAIRIENKIAYIGDKCTHCGKCIEVCPVVKFVRD
jgi:phosphoadenosine phosphosulfate reductase